MDALDHPATVTDAALVVEARAVTKQYRMGSATIEALAAVDLNVADREWVAVMGPSGSGKSTLLNLIGGLDRPDSGSLVVGDRDLGAATSDELARHRRETVGFVFQAFRLLAHLTALENVALPILLGGGSRVQAEAHATKLRDRVGLAARVRHHPPELSAGEQQRVAIARALVSKPRLLLADEPTGNLDPTSTEGVLALLSDLRRDPGLALLVATHDEQVAGRADRIVRLRAGKVPAA
jgi:ABC-type lipoprotein export system ATPase subunit